MKRVLVAVFVPNMLLLGLFVGAFVWERQCQWGLPTQLEFARPVATLLEANGVNVTHVSRAPHYDTRQSVAAAVRTGLGYVNVLQFENEDAARAGLREAEEWCCGHFFLTLDKSRLFWTDNPNLDRLVRRIVSPRRLPPA